MLQVKQFIYTLVLLLFMSVTTAHAATLVKFETSVGDFVVELYPEKAPKTVENFVQYVNDGFYQGTIFHRVISGFMIQGGGFDRRLNRKETRAPIVNEANNGLLNHTGTIAMARTNDPHSATAQFFINLVENAPLNYVSPDPVGIGYCVFGKVVEGMHIIHQIGGMPTSTSMGFANVPIRPIIIKQATLISQ